MTQRLRDTTHAGLVVDYEITHVHAEATTAHQHVLIAETPAFGRALFMDGILMSAESDEALYHSALVHPALFTHPGPRTALIGGGGEGATLREVLRHPTIERATMADIDEVAVGLCREHLRAWHSGAFSDPRTRVIYDDIRAVLERGSEEGYDVIVLDLGDPASSAASRSAATLEFYRLVRGALRPGGIAALQAGEYGFAASHTYRSFITTLGEVFASVRPYRVAIPSFCSVWGFAMMSDAPLPVPPPDLEVRYARIAGDGWPDYDPPGHRAWMWLSRREREALGHDATVLTDARPLELGGCRSR